MLGTTVHSFCLHIESFSSEPPEGSDEQGSLHNDADHVYNWAELRYLRYNFFGAEICTFDANGANIKKGVGGVRLAIR